MFLQLFHVPSDLQFFIDIIPMQIAAERLARLGGGACDTFRLCSSRTKAVCLSRTVTTDRAQKGLDEDFPLARLLACDSDALGSLGRSYRVPRKMDFTSVSRHARIRGLVPDHGPGVPVCSLAQRLEGGSSSPVHSVRKCGWVLGCRRAIDSLLGLDTRTGLHHLPHHLPFARGHDCSFGDPSPRASTHHRDLRHSAVDACNSAACAAGTRVKSCPRISLVRSSDSHFPSLGNPGLFHEVFGECDFAGRSFLLYDSHRPGAQSVRSLDDRFFRSDQYGT